MKNQTAAQEDHWKTIINQQSKREREWQRLEKLREDKESKWKNRETQFHEKESGHKDRQVERTIIEKEWLRQVVEFISHCSRLQSISAAAIFVTGSRVGREGQSAERKMEGR